MSASPFKTPERASKKSKPKSSTPSKTVTLTGHRRVLNDTVVSIYNVVQAWKQCLEPGTKHIQTLQRLRHSSDKNDKELVNTSREQIGDFVRQMEEYVQKLKGYSENLASLSELNKNAPAPFFTWKYSDFVPVANKTYENYVKETKLRSELAKAFSGTVTVPDDVFDWCATAWVHLLYARGLFDLEFETMLYEIGQSEYNTP